jgi:hypothetical protein
MEELRAAARERKMRELGAIVISTVDDVEA